VYERGAPRSIALPGGDRSLHIRAWAPRRCPCQVSFVRLAARLAP
jgi:hypothetical protein